MKLVLAITFISLTVLFILYGIIDLIIFTYKSNKEWKSFRENNTPSQQLSLGQLHHLPTTFDGQKTAEIHRKHLNDSSFLLRIVCKKIAFRMLNNSLISDS